MLRTNKQHTLRAVGSSAHFAASKIINQLKENRDCYFSYNSRYVQLLRKDDVVLLLSHYSKEVRAFPINRLLKDTDKGYKELREAISEFIHIGVYSVICVDGTFNVSTEK